MGDLLLPIFRFKHKPQHPRLQGQEDLNIRLVQDPAYFQLPSAEHEALGVPL